MKLDHCEIGLVVVFKKFIKAQKLGLRSNFHSVTFKDFNIFWLRQASIKRRSSAATIEDLPHLESSSNLEQSLSSKKSESTRKVEFKHIMDLIGTHEVATIFEGLK